MRHATDRSVSLVERTLMSFGPLVNSEWLAAHLGDSSLRLLDTRYYLDGRSNPEGYLSGHIPTAVYADVDRDFTGATGPGRHPLPSRLEFEVAMQSLGVNSDSTVVVYSDTFPEARLRWLFRYYGHQRVAVLNGGLASWPGNLERGPSPIVERGNFAAAKPHLGWTVDFEFVRKLEPSVRLLDARGPDRFRGEVAPGDPRTGHIPGARPAYWRELNLDDRGRFLPAEVLRSRYRNLGVEDSDRVVAYCGSGVQACHILLGLELAGFAGQLYPGSWSDWSRHPDAPVVIGDGPESNIR
jgi:thiosulfate/3-mercaptopyruvate sulfurtransferase